MMLRGVAIVLSLGAAVALWFGYGELRMLRGTVLWEYRYIVFAIAAFLGLSALERALGWLKGKLEGDQDSH